MIGLFSQILMSLTILAISTRKKFVTYFLSPVFVAVSSINRLPVFLYSETKKLFCYQTLIWYCRDRCHAVGNEKIMDLPLKMFTFGHAEVYKCQFQSQYLQLLFRPLVAKNAFPSSLRLTKNQSSWVRGEGFRNASYTNRFTCFPAIQ